MGAIKYGVVAAVLAGGAVAGATSLPAFGSSGVLQSGSSDSASCQTDALSIAYTPDTNANYLKTITVSGIDAACVGKYITVKPVQKNGSGLHSPAGPTDFTQVTGSSESLSTYANAPISQIDHSVVTFSDNPPASKLY